MDANDGRIKIRKIDTGWVIVPEEWDGLAEQGAQSASVPVAGGFVVVSPEQPDGPMGGWLNDLDAASWWIAGVFGEQVAAAILGEQETECDVAWGDQAGPLRRVAMGLWLHRWWPSSSRQIRRLNERLLRVEIGTAAWEAEPCMPDLTLASAMLGQGADSLLPVLARLADLQGAELDAAERLAWDAVHAVLDEGDVDEKLWTTLSQLASEHQAGNHAVAQLIHALEQVADAGREHETSSRLSPALTASSGQSAPADSIDVDWLQVNPRSIRADDENVVVQRFREGDQEAIVIQVEIGDEPNRDGLRARIYLDDDLLPVTQTMLLLQSGSYVGEAEVPFGHQLRVDVFDPDFVTRPRFDHSPSFDRRFVRQIVSSRVNSPLANPGGPFLCELVGTGS